MKPLRYEAFTIVIWVGFDLMEIISHTQTIKLNTWTSWGVSDESLWGKSASLFSPGWVSIHSISIWGRKSVRSPGLEESWQIDVVMLMLSPARSWTGKWFMGSSGMPRMGPGLMFTSSRWTSSLGGCPWPVQIQPSMGRDWLTQSASS